MFGSLLLTPIGALVALAASDPAQPGSQDCAQRLHQVANAQGLAVQPGDRLVSDRAGRLQRDLAAPGEVRLYYLVDRRIGGCPVATVSPVRLDDANRAVGRDLGQERGKR
ncbi:hypothetical protein [Brevundimonas sp. Root1279]|uniref:hypothetical protein n=1 Tax=Brevundimonas sp. Root1279 TaxID=1736443 RepID=UPI0006F32279|nr:hypothetical protein [Brevundimonas sp. Root1279]KQW80918.1 hypothetical protein ASC65_13200 [Brevundimonas sp. Root1279]